MCLKKALEILEFVVVLPALVIVATLAILAGAALGVYDRLKCRSAAYVVLFLAFAALSGCTMFPQATNYYPRTLDPSEVQIVGAYEDIMVARINATLGGAGLACTGSMHPFFGCQNTLLLEKLGPETPVHVGDIVRYEEGDKAFFHQVVAIQDTRNLSLQDRIRLFLFLGFQDIDGTCYIMKGFNVASPDPWCVDREQMTHRAVGVLFTTNSSEVDWE